MKPLPTRDLVDLWIHEWTNHNSFLTEVLKGRKFWYVLLQPWAPLPLLTFRNTSEEMVMDCFSKRLLTSWDVRFQQRWVLRLGRDVVGGAYLCFRGTHHLHNQGRSEVQAVCSSEAQVPVHQTWWCHISQDCNLVTEYTQSEFHTSQQRFLMSLLCLYSEMLWY
jgi:hypothetical protein